MKDDPNRRRPLEIQLDHSSNKRVSFYQGNALLLSGSFIIISTLLFILVHFEGNDTGYYWVIPMISLVIVFVWLYVFIARHLQYFKRRYGDNKSLK